MNTCSLQHEPIAYSCWTCPVCDALHKLEVAEDTIAGLKLEIDDLNFQLQNQEE